MDKNNHIIIYKNFFKSPKILITKTTQKRWEGRSLTLSEINEASLIIVNGIIVKNRFPELREGTLIPKGLLEEIFG